MINLRTVAIFLAASLAIALPAQDLASLFARQLDEPLFRRSLDYPLFVPSDATSWEVLAACEAVSRLCQERLSIPDSFTVASPPRNADLTILIREKFRPHDPVPEEVAREARELQSDQGMVAAYAVGSQNYLLVCGKGQAVRSTALAFFSRFPYFSELLGPEISATYAKVQSSLGAFTGRRFRLDRVRYRFPDREKLKARCLEKFRFPPFTLISLRAVSTEAVEADVPKLRELAAERMRGRRTEVLSFADIGTLELHLAGTTIFLPRSGATLAEATPSYRPFQKKKIKPYTASLESLLSPAGLLVDTNEDGFADALKAGIMVRAEEATPELIDFCGRLSSFLPGISFPAVTLDTDVDDFSSLDFPIFYGRQNRLVKQLVEKGKVQPADLERSAVYLVNGGIGPSPALLITDPAALRWLENHFAALAEFSWGKPTLKSSFGELKKWLSAPEGGDIPYCLSLSKKLAPDSVEGFVSDRWDTARLKQELFPKGQLRRWNEIQVVKEWDLPLGSEGTRLAEEVDRLSPTLFAPGKKLRLEARISESPAVRQELEKRLADHLQKNSGRAVAVEINSSYKYAFFLILERTLPRLQGKGVEHLVIRAPLLKPSSTTQPRRFQEESLRWLQELYPIDDLLSRRLGIGLERIEIVADESLENEYRVEAKAGGRIILDESLPLFPYRRLYLDPFPGWGDVAIAGGMLLVREDDRIVHRQPFLTDLEIFWEYYQKEVLPYLVEHVQKKSGHNPKLDNQPFFSQLKVEAELSEPDLAIGLDEERVSSLEALHDEIYFDTLDLLAGMLHIEPGDKQFNMRKSSPGNILPLIHPSNEGREGSVHVTLTDTLAPEPALTFRKEGREEKKILPDLSEVKSELTGLVIDRGGAHGLISLTCEKEGEFEAVNAIFDSLVQLASSGMLPCRDALLRSYEVHTQCKESKRAFSLQTTPAPAETSPENAAPKVPESILSPAEVVRIARGFSSRPGFSVFTAGKSFESREIPVLFAHDPRSARFSLAKLLLERPTLFFSARQHSNEISATTYVLKTLERLAADPEYAAYRQKLNLLVMPLENPDGAELAFELQKLTPSHSLHAGRYTAKGVDVGYVMDDEKPSVPEAQVRPMLNRAFRPDLYLNLHGYPSHEWVQPFSGYTPFLFRSYWIPKGLFLYFNYLNRPEADPFRQTGQQLLHFLARGLSSLPGNQALVDRYRRWSQRWAPHLNYLDMVDGSLLFHSRENAAFQRVERPLAQLASETPELMDETAQGNWLGELLRQGEAYLKLHLDFFSRLQFEYVTDHYAVDERVFLIHQRLRPGTFKE